MAKKIILTEQQEKDMEQFIQFLKKHKALTKFKTNLKQRGFIGVKSIKRLCSKRTLFNFMLLSFSWAMSPEGDDYWNNLDKLWFKEYMR